MDLIFAKWIFTAVAALQAGTGLDWPIMAAEVEAPAQIAHQLVAEDVWVEPVICPPARPGSPPCTPRPGGFIAGKLRQFFCLTRGVYAVELRVGMLPTMRAPADGRIWLVENAPGARPELLLEFAAEARVGTYQAGVTSIRVPEPTCYMLRYDSTGAARVNPDPRVTALTIRD